MTRPCRHFLLAALLIAGCLAETRSQTAPPLSIDAEQAPLTLSGSSRFYALSANRQGSFQDRPERYLRWELDPTLALYGVPISFNILLSTEEESFRQDINAFTALFSPENIQALVLQRVSARLRELEQENDYTSFLADEEGFLDSLRQHDPERVKHYEEYRELRRLSSGDADMGDYLDRLESMGLVSGTERFFMSLPAIGVGTIYPRFTPLTLGSVSIDGGSLEWNPGNFYLHLAGGRTRIPILRRDTVPLSHFGQELYAGRIGFGRKDGSHVIFSALYGRDDESSLRLDSNNEFRVSPRENLVAGIDLRLDAIRNRLSFDAELAGSLLTEDVRGPGIDSEDVPDVANDLFDPKVGTHGDIALAVGTTLRIPETSSKLAASLRFVGPGYFSYGVPTLRSDLLRFDVKATQSVWKRQLTFNAQYRRDEDNLIEWKRATTIADSYTIGLGLNIRRLPYLRISYSPSSQSSSEADSGIVIDNSTSLINVASGYSYRIGSVGASSNLLFSHLDGSSLDSAGQFTTSTYGFNQNVYFRFPLTIALSLNLSDLSYEAFEDYQSLYVDAAVGYTFFEELTVSLGTIIAREGDNSQRSGLFATADFPLWVLGRMELRADQTVYEDDLITANSYDEFMLRATLTSNW